MSTSLNMSFRILYGFWWQTQMTLLWWLTRYLQGNSNVLVLHELYACWGEWGVQKERVCVCVCIFVYVNIYICLHRSKLVLMFTSASRRVLASFMFFCILHKKLSKNKNYLIMFTCIFRSVTWVEINYIFLKLFYS